MLRSRCLRMLRSRCLCMLRSRGPYAPFPLPLYPLFPSLWRTHGSANAIRICTHSGDLARRCRPHGRTGKSNRHGLGPRCRSGRAGRSRRNRHRILACAPGRAHGTTSENGDYIIPVLPAGDYEVKFELQGFKTTTRPVSVKMAETLPLNVTLAIAAVAESVTVTGASPDIVPTATIAANFKKEVLERLPVGRALNDAVLLAPGVAGNGPSSNIMMAGALSFESQYLVNGVVINENLRGQALNLFIEDAIQETKVSTGAISAEYGRFGGGVVNMITKSGGNRFSGSFRTTFDNDAWRSLTPFPSDQTVNAVTPTYEMTAGGPVVKDKPWYFGAGRFTKPARGLTLAVTGGNYTARTH